ncbi:MAG: hypothetical protein PWQ17_53 [Anaerophaga sp.]|jgi:hypothetical protein|uniref:hypothetical protein n=1 Tax=Anaerophaga thermohalophila TaxID=177400 RepID=UPI000300CAF6|nr:hypothetical protein [Anaerophaga thermohalophila]MDK2840548.1 hypothetical protein [Anaerophaga sp.]
MAGEQLMGKEDLHFLGIKVVYKDLIDNGYEVLNVRKEPDIDPQILARRNGNLLFIVVRTATFPDMGVLTPRVAARVSMHARKHRALCYFASVGIANANGDTDEEMGKPEIDGEYYINYKGLQPFPQ